MTKFISCEFKCKFDGKKHHICEKDYIWNPSTFNFKNGIYLASIIDASLIMCDEIIDANAKLNNKETKIAPTNFNEINVTCKTQNFYFFTCLFINYHCIIDSC